jgi:hypothetical protein
MGPGSSERQPATSARFTLCRPSCYWRAASNYFLLHKQSFMYTSLDRFLRPYCCSLLERSAQNARESFENHSAAGCVRALGVHASWSKSENFFTYLSNFSDCNYTTLHRDTVITPEQQLGCNFNSADVEEKKCSAGETFVYMIGFVMKMTTFLQSSSLISLFCYNAI